MKINLRLSIQRQMKRRKISIPVMARRIECHPQTLYDFFAGRKALGECIRQTDNPRLSVMTAGEAMISPMQAFALPLMKKIITDVLATNDYLVFDAPPTLQYPETTVLSSQVDGVVFVAQAVRTKKEVVRKAVEALAKGGGEVLGLVLNKNKHYIPGFIYKRV